MGGSAPARTADLPLARGIWAGFSRALVRVPRKLALPLEAPVEHGVLPGCRGLE